MRAIVGAGLLASAFAPLLALIAVLKLPTLGWVSWAILAGCLLSLVLLWLVFRSLARIQPRPVESVEVRREDERALTFASSYIVPVVVALFGDDVASLAATVLLILLLVVIYVRAGLYHLNPTLAVVGFRLYQVTAASGAVTMVLSRSRYLPQQGVVECRYLGDDVAIQLKGRP
ncbi:hypothetical protein ACFWN7_05075 [Agromyces sp. NPDC058484]|uniref:hypothetical protein n=1 Tax=Agromyces sp. NPDC058484 TaxID=3346524 RepID=UPI003667B427